MIFFRKFLFFLLALVFSIAARSQVELILAPNSSGTTYSSNPRCFVEFNDEVYFGATDFYGWGFWKTDGSPEGTSLITRKVYPSNTYNALGKILIIGHDPYGNPLNGFWISDGTEEGTVLIAECDGLTAPQFTTVGNKVFFRLRKDVIELWVTEGTTETTHRVAGTEGVLISPDHLAAIGNRLYFSASDGISGAEPWISDGTIEGTLQLKEISSGSSNPFGFCEMNGKVYFIARGDGPAALFSTDGTAENTVSEATFPEYLEILDNNFKQFREIQELGDTLYFQLKNTQTYMNDIFRFVEGDSVSLVHGFPQNSKEYPTNLYRIDNKIITFIQYPYPQSPERLNIMRINGSGAEVYRSIIQLSGTWDFSEACDSVIYFEYAGRLWRTNGTSSGTFQMNDLFIHISAGSDQAPVLVTGERIYFSPNSNTFGTEPWTQRLNGEAAALLKDINLSMGNTWINVAQLHDDQIFFTATSPSYGSELWITSTGESSASMIKDIHPGAGGSNPRNFILYRNELYFTADDSARQVVGRISGNEVNASSNLWKSDGTTQGTEKISEFITGFSRTTDWEFTGSEMVELNGKIILGGSVPSQDEDLLDVELFETDGTAEGMHLIKNINPVTDPYTESSKPFALRRVGDQVFFTAATEMEGRELWVTDGTDAGTNMVKDILSLGSASSLTRYSIMTPFGNRLLFTAYEGEPDWELWISDGTGQGTIRLTNIAQVYGTTFHYLSVVNDRAVFWVSDRSAENIREMWVTDGTAEGTRMLRSSENQYYYMNHTEYPLGVWNNELYFTGTDGNHGLELWKTDGTAEGTMMVKDIFVGPGHALPAGFVSLEDNFYFFATTGVGHTLLWSSDGTEEGTTPVDGWNGSEMKDFGNAVNIGGFLYFSATSPDEGEALFRFYLGTSDIPEDPVEVPVIYPNPAKDFVSVNLMDSKDPVREVEVIDFSGRVILKREWSDVSDGRNIDISSLESGVYILRMKTDHTLFSGKLIKL